MKYEYRVKVFSKRTGKVYGDQFGRMFDSYEEAEKHAKMVYEFRYSPEFGTGYEEKEIAKDPIAISIEKRPVMEWKECIRLDPPKRWRKRGETK